MTIGVQIKRCMATGGRLTSMVWLLVATAAQAVPAGSSPIVGCWRCESEGDTSVMEFRDDGTLTVDGETSSYELGEGVIRMRSEVGPIDYPYVISGKTLTLSLMGVIQIPCTRISCGEGQTRSRIQAPEGELELGESARPDAPPAGGEYLLSGMFCHWSGSSSSYSGGSYSHSIRVSFDGQGHFATGSESSFNNPSGLGYGSGDGSGGTYRVVGNEVRLQFNDGSSGVATIELREGDGRVTALKYNGDLYSPQLCD